MRMFVVTVLGVAGLIGLFVCCVPLREQASRVVLGQEPLAQAGMASPQPHTASSGAARDNAVPALSE